jgi:lipoprotein-anchoring transpeptidase ErfK/SrfK
MRKGKLFVIAASAAAVACVLSACTTGTSANGAPTTGASSLPSSAAAVESTTSAPSQMGESSPSGGGAAVVTVAPTPGKQISPTTPITVSVADGTVQHVELVNDAGKQVTGTLSADGLTWTNNEPLGYGRTYTLSATATNADGKKTVKRASYTTLSPPNQTMPYFYYTGNYSLQNGATYGVGIVPIVHWDEPITDPNAALDTITITTTPHVAGAWYWADAQNVAFRPAATRTTNFWPANTKVTIHVKDYGRQVSPGLYGQADASIHFKIGRQQITQAYDNAPKVNKVKVYLGKKLLRTMNTSMGRHSSMNYNGLNVSFFTMNGTYTVLEHDNPARMTSASYGIPVGAPGSYDELIYYATKISTDGIYLHELDNTVWDQDNGFDVSHGCLNLNYDNAVWFYRHSLIGDPVVVHGTKGAPEITYAQGGAWSVPWKVWVAGGRRVS